MIRIIQKLHVWHRDIIHFVMSIHLMVDEALAHLPSLTAHLWLVLKLNKIEAKSQFNEWNPFF